MRGQYHIGVVNGRAFQRCARPREAGVHVKSDVGETHDEAGAAQPPQRGRSGNSLIDVFDEASLAAALCSRSSTAAHSTVSGGGSTRSPASLHDPAHAARYKSALHKPPACRASERTRRMRAAAESRRRRRAGCRIFRSYQIERRARAVVALVHSGPGCARVCCMERSPRLHIVKRNHAGPQQRDLSRRDRHHGRFDADLARAAIEHRYGVAERLANMLRGGRRKARESVRAGRGERARRPRGSTRAPAG